MSDAVRQIKDRLNIIDVVSPYVELHKAGRHFKGKSPFSNERTPSFYVSPERGMYYCFSTSQGGDMFSFIQTMEGVDFKQALKILAEKANVELVPEAPEKRTERERLHALLEEAAAFFVDWLPLTPTAVKYLDERGVKPATIAKWRIGYAPGPHAGGWRLLKEHLTAKGYTVNEMLKTGVIKPGTEGKDHFDVFRDRIMFPLRDASGKVVGFSGRTLFPDEKTPKYVNSPETEFYKKSELLFGYDLAKNAIRTLDFSLIVEGQFDVVMSQQAGYSNTVAVSGTALTLHHVQLLERLSTRVVLALDADRAGIAAMRRAADLMLRRGLDVKVARLPQGADPADLVKENTAALKHAVGGAVHVIEFLLEYLKESVRDERTYKLRVRDEVLPYITLIPNRIDQEHFIGVVAAALGAQLDAVRFEVTRIEEQGSARGDLTDATVIATQQKGATKIERVRPPQRAELITHVLAAVSLVDDTRRNALIEALSESAESTFEALQESQTPETLARATFVIESDIERYSQKSFIEDVVAKLNLIHDLTVREAMAIHKQALYDIEHNGADGNPERHLEALSALEKRRKKPPYQITLLTP